MALLSHALLLGAVSVRQHDGLFSLNDLHRASGGKPGHRPGNFLQLDQTKALIAEIANAGIPAFESRRGAHGGTYACRELVIAYAAWISAAFHLRVIRVFLAASSPDAARMALAARAAGALVAAATTAHPHDVRFVVDVPSGNVAPVGPGVQFSTWLELADTVAQQGAFMASSDLTRLAAACMLQLAQRLPEFAAPAVADVQGVQ